MACYLSNYEGKGYRLGLLLLLLLLSPSLPAAGMPSPAAVAQAFANAYRGGNAEAIVALQYFADGSRGPAAAQRERERLAWLWQIGQMQILSYRLANLLAQDQALLTEQPLLPGKKLVVEYAGRSGRVRESYLIAQQGGLYYLLPAHVDQ